MGRTFEMATGGSYGLGNNPCTDACTNAAWSCSQGVDTAYYVSYMLYSTGNIFGYGIAVAVASVNQSAGQHRCAEQYLLCYSMCID